MLLEVHATTFSNIRIMHDNDGKWWLDKNRELVEICFMIWALFSSILDSFSFAKKVFQIALFFLPDCLVFTWITFFINKYITFYFNRESHVQYFNEMMSCVITPNHFISEHLFINWFLSHSLLIHNWMSLFSLEFFDISK